MPRLTNTDYLHIRRGLRQAWLDAGKLFAFLTPREQWYLHDYFRPSEDLTDVQALQHRVDITKQCPNLPQQAGRAVTTLEHGGNPNAVTVSHGMQVRGTVKPTIDVEGLVQALLRISQELDKPPDEPNPDGSHVKDSAA